MRIAVLWINLTGYLNACLRELNQMPGVKLFVAHQTSRNEAPFAEDQFGWIEEQYRYTDQPNTAELVNAVRKFDPELLIVAAWAVPAYRAVCKEMGGRSLRVCGMDHQWRGRPKQWLGVLTSKVYVQRLFDAAFVTGERQAVFARKLGFPPERIWRGLYSCDFSKFEAAGRGAPSIDQRRSFLYVGRLVPEKGIETLIAAYRRYRAEAQEPWPLKIAGTGPLGSMVEGEPGMEYQGFIQPDGLPSLFGSTGCFVLASRFEPWGVVIHEAAAAGLPVICTAACGSSDQLVKDGSSGFVVETDDPVSLAEAMKKVSDLTREARTEMGRASYKLACQITPTQWANVVLGRSEELIGSLRTAALEST
jgi:glycosyltransferase involved in cell wall biosynthesis